MDTHCVCALCRTAGLGFYRFLSTWIKSDMFDHLGPLDIFPRFHLNKLRRKRVYMRRRPLLLTVLPPDTIPSVIAPRCLPGRRKGARAALSVAAARGGRARPCMPRRTPKPKVRAPTPSGLRPRGHGSSDLFLSLALYSSSLQLLSPIHAISFLCCLEQEKTAGSLSLA
jgi:hypothetical protein